MGRKRVVIAVPGILIIGIVLYAGAGIVYAAALTSNADRALSDVVSHEASLNKAFTGIDSEVKALGSNASFDAQQALTLVDGSVASLQVATATIDQDDSSLAAVQGQLGASRWLTQVARGSVDRDSGRVVHARSGLVAARTVAADEVVDGHFWHSFYMALGEIDTLNNQAGSGDLTSAKATQTKLTADVQLAIQQSSSPGLPSDLQSLIADLQTFVGDFGKQLDAQIAGDNASVAQYQSSLDADRMKLGSYDVDKIGTEIDGFYQPLISRFNSEIAAAASG